LFEGVAEMARAKKSESKELANWDEDLAKYAQEAADKESSSGGGNYMSTKNGNFTYKGDDIPSPFPTIVLDAVFDNAYYPDAYDDDNPASPICFAIGDDEKTLQPHPDCSDPQSDFCEGCWANKYKSGDNGKGKACKNQRRLALVAADVLDDIDENAEVAMLKVSPTSLKFWGGYVKKITQVLKRPPFAVIANVSLEPEKSYHVLQFEIGGKVPNNMLGTMRQLSESCQEDLHAGYPAFEETEEATTSKRRPASKKKAVTKKKAAPKKKAVVKKKRKF